MKIKLWLVALMLVGLLAVALGTTPVFAQEPTTGVPDNATWDEMHQACSDGNYEAMQQLHNEYWGGDGASGGMMGGQGGMMGPNGMMGGWNGQGNTTTPQSITPRSTPRFGGGMMGSW